MISLVVTVRNEAQNIEAFLESVFSQSKNPDEIIIVDGGSDDGTLGTIQKHREGGIPFKLIVSPGANIAKGRNIAIEEAQGGILAVTDAGCKLKEDWLEKITYPLLSCQGETIDVTYGHSAPWAETFFQTCLAICIVGLPEETRATLLMPSSRCLAIRRSVWERAGRYPEWLDVAEDMYLDIQLRRIGACFTYVPDAVVYWEPKRNSKEVIWQSFRYGFWDAQAGVFRRSYILRFLGYSIGGLSAAAGFLNHLFWLLFLALVLLRLKPSIGRIPRYGPNWRTTQVISGLLLIIYLVLLIDVSKMGGYLLGLSEMWKKNSARLEGFQRSIKAHHTGTFFDAQSTTGTGSHTINPTPRNHGFIALVPSNPTFRTLTTMSMGT
jgi:glycosyltransferase involved in cell wall biosynthesis